MNFDDRLTILLLLKGRHEYTFRWLEYAKFIQCPFHIYVADGSFDNEIETYFSNSLNENNLNITYKKYPLK